MSPRPRACGRQGAGPAAGGEHPHERNHGAGDHPIPSRTRQLSPASPKVLRRQVAGGQGVPLMGDGFGPAAGPGRPPDPTRIRGLRGGLLACIGARGCGFRQRGSRIAELEAQLPEQRERGGDALKELYKIQRDGSSLVDLVSLRIVF